MHSKPRLLAALLLFSAIIRPAPARAQPPSPPPPPSTPLTPVAAPPAALSPAELAQAQQLITRAAAFLRSKQDPATGGWSVNPNGPNFPAITALAVAGLADLTPSTPNTSSGPSDEAVAKGIKFILNYQQPDGGIYDKILPSYNTSIALVALAKVNTPQAKAAIKPAQDFLRSIQYGEGAITREAAPESAADVGKDHPFYGGVGYGRHGRPDLSNTAWFLEGLHASGVNPDDPAFQRALTFLQRTQMLDQRDGKPGNDADFADGSAQGGFIYSTSVNKDRVGVGQSFAGEIAESLSGGPGTLVLVRLGNAEPRKPRTLSRADIEARIREAADPRLADGFLVLLTQTPDNLVSTTFELRLPITDAATARDLVQRLFATELQSIPSGASSGTAPETQLSDASIGEEALRAEFRRLAGRDDRSGLIIAAPVQAWRGLSRLRAYGSMTYSGFKSYIYANLSRNDPRVTAAMDWIRRNYTLAENPGLGTDGLYYYYVVFARAMAAWGDPTIDTITPAGAAAPRRWAADLVARLAELQDPDGSFRSVDNRWMEDDRILITSYALLALNDAVRAASPPLPAAQPLPATRPTPTDR